MVRLVCKPNESKWRIMGLSSSSLTGILIIAKLQCWQAWIGKKIYAFSNMFTPLNHLRSFAKEFPSSCFHLESKASSCIGAWSPGNLYFLLGNRISTGWKVRNKTRLCRTCISTANDSDLRSKANMTSRCSCKLCNENTWLNDLPVHSKNIESFTLRCSIICRKPTMT